MVQGHRGTALILLAFAGATAVGCTSVPREPTSTSSSSVADPAPGAGAETAEPPEEEAGPSPKEEGGGSESAAPGPDTVSVQFAGLPVGGGAVTLVDDGWCQVLFWGGQLPEEVVLRIERVVVGPGGGAVVNAGCMGAPPCLSQTMSTEQPEQGCAVLVRPPTSDAAKVLVRLDGVLTCPDVATCNSISTGSGGFTSITSPVRTAPGCGPTASPTASACPSARTPSTSASP